ncbi:ABC transporter ATP-binding protein [Kytococcus sedentarius]|uniref:ABC-type antimicrobial peptide transport system, ATPase component n=1 Tax=Kytococcus sedentarius (strain ATCC 14392 / DSM 20547 / JCM 11482 / CCUG 33030 / NBRC 15357 / NCTC 11040 / CCM 314 / 541) TaxID=478801 RepID=C7NFZ4_KYTSD|nr:ABC transporter ATP-binding protein [Kytococcus sedentarius]ACV05994.1 ABC-type antimicrobial peptide transport system, ATPase component [Kytococcus sedentarius DSM 20547]QQB64374.1 ABC transporter ATP-binding protein [Kytococcus sedentarius]STX12587.1 Macrolide export ATP-binding/permease protein MacB [Kytococcus sedentarius]
MSTRAGWDSPPRLEARALSFGYTPQEPLLQEWDAAFEAGSMTALTGPSGRGKSTLMYLLGLMLRPSSGAILLDGVDAVPRKDAELARLRAERFGFVFQDAALDTTRTVLDNVTETALYRGVARSTVSGAARELMERFGVDLPPERKPGQVSGGQAQRIALCRALLNQPSVLLADEPTGNLDPASSGVVVDALRQHASRGAAVVLVTHSPELAAACDREIRL